MAYLPWGKRLSDLSTFKAKEDEHYLQRVLRNKPGFIELNPCSSIHFHIFYNWTEECGPGLGKSKA